MFFAVIPVETGIKDWIPAFAGMTLMK